RSVPKVDARLRAVGSGIHVVVADADDFIRVEGGDLVPFGRLPRQAKSAFLRRLPQLRRPTEVRRVEERPRRLVVVVAGNLLIAAPFSAAHVEPQVVFSNRTAEAATDGVDVLHRRRGDEAARTQLIVEVVALHAAVRVIRLEETLEDVAAASWHHVD